MSKLVCLDAGHGGQDPGAVFGNLREKDLTLTLVHEIEACLESYGIRTVLTRGRDHYLTLPQRCRIANLAQCDAIVSIHFNADPDPDLPGMAEASGAEVWHFTSSKNGKALAQEVGDRFRKSVYAGRYRGIKSNEKFYMLKHTNAPACLVETAFIDNRQDMTLLTQPGVLAEVAGLIALGIRDFLNSRP
jgi:N-acetylmuramoyl-L-alanine amidase